HRLQRRGPRPQPWMPLGQRGGVRREIGRAAASAGRNQRLRREPARLDRRPDALAALGIRQPRGIADEQQSFSRCPPASRPRRQVRMAAPPDAGRAVERLPPLEELDERLHVAVEALAAAPADADVEVLALAYGPGVAFEVAAEEQL